MELQIKIQLDSRAAKFRKKREAVDFYFAAPTLLNSSPFKVELVFCFFLIQSSLFHVFRLWSNEIVRLKKDLENSPDPSGG
jgi:hypothetical protein